MAATSSSANRSGRSDGWLARVWKTFVRQELRLARWMVAHGVPASLSVALLWLLKIAVIVLVGYVLFWLAVVIGILFVAVRVLQHAEPDRDLDALELRPGVQGLGFYNHNGDRVISYDPTEDP